MSEDRGHGHPAEATSTASSWRTAHLRFVTGRRKKVLEQERRRGGPGQVHGTAESTSIHLIQSFACALSDVLPDRRLRQADIDKYNQQTHWEFERIRDFRCCTITRPSAQRHAVLEPLPHDVHSAGIEGKDGPVPRQRAFLPRADELFGVTSWVQVMIGQGMMPRAATIPGRTTSPKPNSRNLSTVLECNPALRGRDAHAWRVHLQELRDSGVQTRRR